MTPLARAAQWARRLLAFDEALLFVSQDAEQGLLYSDRGRWQGGRRTALSEVSGTLRSSEPLSIEDAERNLDLAHPIDRELVARGLRSLLVVPLSGGDGESSGHLWLGSRRPAAFRPEDREPAIAIAGLLSPSVEQERALAAMGEERRRLESLSLLLPMVASTLDIREIFHRVSAVARGTLPHDALGVQILPPAGDTIVSYVVSDLMPGDPQEFPRVEEIDQLSTDLLVEDVEFERTGDSERAVVRGRLLAGGEPRVRREIVAPLDPDRSRLVREHRFRSFLRVPLREGDRTIGALVFASTARARFEEAQLGLAHCIADHVSLALAHKRLAEEAAAAAEARVRAAALEERVESLVRAAEERDGFHRTLGVSKAWKEVLRQATKVAPTETTVLLTGESGTGKEVVAHFIHRASPRSKGPLVAINCAALPDQLLESELFGYERGAFSGATASKPGRIEHASGGVLFLDEVGEMSLSLQAKLLRVIQEREFQRLGGMRTLRADVRVVAATNRDLPAAIRRNEFREDLYYRLGVFEIRMPPLRERREDVLPLTEAFLADLEKAVGRRTAGLSREAKEILLSYDWPGNVRELRNAIERAVILCDGGLITGEQLPMRGASGESKAAGGEEPSGPLSGSVNLESMERALIEKALSRARNNKSQAARLLGLTRAQLYWRLEKYGLAEPSH
jgi:transcriptional regulator with GAF, ATPase, and Fis domain